MTELVYPLENLLSNGNRPHKGGQPVGSTVEITAQQTIDDEECAQNQVISAVGGRKRNRSCQDHQEFLSTTTAANEEANEEATYNSGGNDTAILERGRKALKTNEDYCSATASCSAKSSNQPVTPISNDSLSHPTSVTKQNASASLVESPGISQTEYLEIIELLEDTPLQFQKHVKILMTYKARFGHCNVTFSKAAWNKPYKSLGQWCIRIREVRLLMDEGKPPGKYKRLFKAEIDILDALGFQWKKINYFDQRLKDLKAFKAKFGHCNVPESIHPSNKSYQKLAQWCKRVRVSRRSIDEGKPPAQRLSKAQIERLDAVGFQWKKMNYFDERLKELKAFKAKFGHCNVTASSSTSNQPYFLLGKWCLRVRDGRKSLEEGKQKCCFKVTKAQIESLDALGFQWKTKSFFDKQIEDLMAFKAKFGHCNVPLSKTASNAPYWSLGEWCKRIRESRRLMEVGKWGSMRIKLSKAKIERLDTLGFQWEIKFPMGS